MKSAPAWFVTGTDTEVGKTFVSCALLHAFTDAGIGAIGMKPIAAGCDESGENEDVAALLAAAGVKAPRELVNPYLFGPAIAPHIAAAEENRRIEIAPIVRACEELRRRADAVIVEGVGGFCVPLDDATDTADLAAALALPVILVVGLRLGCINHALLTQLAIESRGLSLAGWIANGIDADMPRREENLAALASRLRAPLLGVVPPSSTPEAAAKLLRLPV